MNRKIKIRITLLLATSWISVFNVFPVSAEETLGGDYGDQVAVKLERGVRNTAGGWVELPLAIKKEIQRQGWFQGPWRGLGLGLGRSLVRTGVGALETATFFYPTQPLIKEVKD